MYVVYVIRSIEGLIYTGSTEDFQKRLFQHNNKLAGWTKRGNNWKPFILEYYHTLSEARKRERWFKTGCGRDYIRNILKFLSIKSHSE